MNPLVVLAIFAACLALKMLMLTRKGGLSARRAWKAAVPLVMGAFVCLFDPGLGAVAMGVGESWNPSSGHINQALTDLIPKHPTAFNYIADEIANVKMVNKESDLYWFMLNAGMINQTARVKRAAGAESNKIEVQWTQDSYQCSEKALHDDLPWSTRDNADAVLGLEMEHAAAPREAVLLAKEINSAAILFSTTYVTNTASTAARWDDSTPANVKLWKDILDAQYYVAQLGGAGADHLAMGFVTWKNVAVWVMSQGGTGAGIRWNGIQQMLKENPLAIPTHLGPLRLLVGNATYSTADRPANVSRAKSGGNLTDVWSDNALVFHKGTPGVKSIQFAARFMKTGWPHVRQGSYAGPRECDWFEYSENESGVKIIAASCGMLLTNTET